VSWWLGAYWGRATLVWCALSWAFALLAARSIRNANERED
jgi:hypothetical protein